MALVQVFILCFLVIQNVVPTHCQGIQSTGFCEEFVEPYKYTCLEYMVQTSDGFLLAIQKITSFEEKKKGMAKRKPNKAPVFLQHGLMQGGETWVLNPIDNSLAFMMADAGYEVWIGNSRTCKFSFGHSIYTKNNEEYWDWTWDDLLTTDLPTMLKFVHNYSKRSIYFVGYSQGTMSAFAALSKRKLVNVIAKGVFLAPIGSLGHVSSNIIKVASFTLVDQILLLASVKEFNAKNNVGKTFLDLICNCSQIDCEQDFMTQITGPNCCVNQSRIAYYEEYSLQPTSMKNLAHLAQMVRSGKFCKYDYGVLDNINIYNSLIPPEYDVSKIPTALSMLLIHGGKDMLADPEDVEVLVKKLKKKPQVIKLSKYAHGDFIMGTSANKDVYIPIIEFFDS